MGAVIRKASGTRNMTDVLLSWLRIKVLSTADDMSDYKSGVVLKVSCFAAEAEAGKRLRAGHLYVGRDEPLVWRAVNGGREIRLRRPLTLRKDGEKNLWPMGSFLLGDLPVRLPLADIEFLEFALRQAD